MRSQWMAEARCGFALAPTANGIGRSDLELKLQSRGFSYLVQQSPSNFAKS